MFKKIISKQLPILMGILIMFLISNNLGFSISFEEFSQITGKTKTQEERACMILMRDTAKQDFQLPLPFSTFLQFLNASEAKTTTRSIILTNLTLPQNHTWFMAGIGKARPTRLFQREYVILYSYNQYGLEGCMFWNAEPIDMKTNIQPNTYRIFTSRFANINGTSYYVRSFERSMEGNFGDTYIVKGVIVYLTQNPTYAELYLIDNVQTRIHTKCTSEISSLQRKLETLKILSVILSIIAAIFIIVTLRLRFVDKLLRKGV